MCVKVIASQRWDDFLRHGVVILDLLNLTLTLTFGILDIRNSGPVYTTVSRSPGAVRYIYVRWTWPTFLFFSFFLSSADASASLVLPSSSASVGPSNIQNDTALADVDNPAITVRWESMFESAGVWMLPMLRLVGHHNYSARSTGFSRILEILYGAFRQCSRVRL